MKITVSSIAKKAGKSRDSVYIFLRKKYKVQHNEDLPKELTEEDERDYIEYQNQKNKNVDKLLSDSKCKDINKKFKPLTREEKSTLKVRLSDLKDKYDFNKKLSLELESEIDTYISNNNNTVMTSGNGSMTSIPQVDKYDKVMNTIMKLTSKITECEERLGIIPNEEERKTVFVKFDE